MAKVTLEESSDGSEGNGGEGGDEGRRGTLLIVRARGVAKGSNIAGNTLDSGLEVELARNARHRDTSVKAVKGALKNGANFVLVRLRWGSSTNKVNEELHDVVNLNIAGGEVDDHSNDNGELVLHTRSTAINTSLEHRRVGSLGLEDGVFGLGGHHRARGGGGDDTSGIDGRAHGRALSRRAEPEGVGRRGAQGRVVRGRVREMAEGAVSLLHAVAAGETNAGFLSGKDSAALGKAGQVQVARGTRPATDGAARNAVRHADNIALAIEGIAAVSASDRRLSARGGGGRASGDAIGHSTTTDLAKVCASDRVLTGLKAERRVRSSTKEQPEEAVALSTHVAAA